MEVTFSFDYGDNLVSPSEIKISINLSLALGEVMIMPDIRETISQGLIPMLRHLKMSEREIRDWENSIRYSQKLYQDLPYPYYMSIGSRSIKNYKNKGVWYSIQDLLEGKVPDISVESLNLD